MNHHLSALLRDAKGKPRGRGSRGRFAAVEEPRGAVIFVHGFKGSAIDTWLNFPFALERESRVEDYDLLFYGYDTREQAGISAGDFRQFLAAVAEDPANALVNPSLAAGLPRRAPDFRYRHIVIAAHSLGAVVVRLALLQSVGADHKPLPWLSKVRLALFAPAHSGALALNLATMLFGGVPVFGAMLLTYAKKRYLSIDSLDDTRPLLKGLHSDTEQLLRNGPQALVACHRAQVIHASKEWVVTVGQFHEDAPYETLPDADHFAVCKPTMDRRRPLDFLLSVIP